MENPFSISEDKLRLLLDAFSRWNKVDEKDANYASNQRQKAEDLKKTLLNKDYLLALNDEELSQKIYDFSRSLEGPAFIRLGMPRISGEAGGVRRNIIYLLESSDDPFVKATRILEGDYKIPIFAKAFWSPIFQAQHPEILPNWNNKSEHFLKRIGIDLGDSKLSAEEKYRRLSKAFTYLKEFSPALDFFHINHLMHYGTSVPEGSKLLAELIGKAEISYFQIAPGEAARLWEDLYKNSIAAVGYGSMNDDLSGLTKD